MNWKPWSSNTVLATKNVVFSFENTADAAEWSMFMKMIRAIVRPQSADAVTSGLAEAGFYSLTKLSVFGRGKQKGITVGETHYDELPKTMILLVVPDSAVDEILKIIKYKAYTGSFGDGKVFISPVDDALTVRTGEHAL